MKINPGNMLLLISLGQGILSLLCILIIITILTSYKSTATFQYYINPNSKPLYCNTIAKDGPTIGYCMTNKYIGYVYKLDLVNRKILQ